MVFRRRPLLRAAAVGGAAYMAGKGSARRQAAEQQQATPVDPTPVETGGSSVADQLHQLTELHRRGDLTDEEFTAAKAGVLGTSA